MQRRLWKQILVIHIIFCVESTSIFRCGAHRQLFWHIKHMKTPIWHGLCLGWGLGGEEEPAECIVAVMGPPSRFLPKTHFKTKCRNVLMCLYLNKSRWSAKYAGLDPKLVQMCCTVIPYDLSWTLAARLYPGSIFIVLNVCILKVYVIFKAQKAFYAHIIIINLIHG